MTAVLSMTFLLIFGNSGNEGKMVVEKCNSGYINNRKKISFLWLLFYIVIAAAIFLVGYLWTQTRANVLTVMAVLMVLPAAKRIVNLIVMLPRKSVEKSRYEEMKKQVGTGVLLADYVFTSTEKIMHLDFVVIKDGNVLAVTAPSKQDSEYMKKYLADSVHKAASGYVVKVFDSDEQLLKQLSGMRRIEGAKEKEEKVVEYLRSLAV
jgi:hypothetical protein